MKRPMVSVVVIAKNEEKNIGDCLASLSMLDYPNYEVVVVDSSADRTADIAKSFRGVRVVKNSKPGFANARNLGVRKSRGEIIAFTDADCIVPRDWLKLVSHLKGKTVAAGGAALPPKDSDFVGKCVSCLGLPAGGALGTEIMVDISTCNAVFLKKAIEKVGYFDSRLMHGTEDSDMSKRIKEAGYGIAIVPDSFVFHKTRSGREFLRWCYRRGKAKFHRSKNPLIILSPLSVFVFPFTKKFRVMVRKRDALGISLVPLVLMVTFLFLIRQIMVSLGWLGGTAESLGRKKEHKEVQG
jgi:glycosyltransferase involved in cell wall biosynthesis